MLIHLLGARRAVVVAEQAQKRCAQARGHRDRRDRLLVVQLVRRHHHAAAPLLDHRIDVGLLAGIDERMPPAGAGADQPDLAVVVRLRAHPLHSRVGVAHHLRVGDAAVGAHLRGHVVRITVAAAAFALIQIGADGHVAVMGEAAGGFDIQLAPARQMVDQHHARERAGAFRLGDIGGDRVPVVAFDGHIRAGHASVKRHSFLHVA